MMSVGEIRKRYSLKKMESQASQMVILGVRLAELGFKSYSEYLKSAKWAGTREHWHRKNPLKSCECCGQMKPLQLHHRVYNRMGCESAKDLMGLCDWCHKTLHFMAKGNRGIRLDMPFTKQSKANRHFPALMAQFYSNNSQASSRSVAPAVTGGSSRRFPVKPPLLAPPESPSDRVRIATAMPPNCSVKNGTVIGRIPHCLAGAETV